MHWLTTFVLLLLVHAASCLCGMDTLNTAYVTLAPADTSCSQACALIGRSCDEQGLGCLANVTKVNSNMLSLVEMSGATCTSYITGYGSSSAVPLLNADGGCSMTTDSRVAADNDCAALPSSGGNTGSTGKRRLCYCTSPCPAGSYTSTSGICSVCALGTYSDSETSSACTACPVGKFAATAGLTTCSDCAAGQATNSIGSTACHTCGAGTYATGGSAECMLHPECLCGLSEPCIDNTFSNVVQGGTSCTARLLSGSPAVENCPTGKTDCQATDFARNLQFSQKLQMMVYLDGAKINEINPHSLVMPRTGPVTNNNTAATEWYNEFEAKMAELGSQGTYITSMHEQTTGRTQGLRAEVYDVSALLQWGGNASTLPSLLASGELSNSLIQVQNSSLSLTSSQKCSSLGWANDSYGVCSRAVCQCSSIASDDCDVGVVSNSFGSVNNAALDGTGSYTEAAGACSALGARLCTVQEVMRNSANTGCSTSTQGFWTSKKCGYQSHFISAWGSKRVLCVSDTSASRIVCCSGGSQMTAWEGLLVPPQPASYTLTLTCTNEHSLRIGGTTVTGSTSGTTVTTHLRADGEMFRLTHVQTSNSSVCSLSWASSALAAESVPHSAYKLTRVGINVLFRVDSAVQGYQLATLARTALPTWSDNLQLSDFAWFATMALGEFQGTWTKQLETTNLDLNPWTSQCPLEMATTSITNAQTCSRDDCKTYATCPSGTFPLSCTSSPANGGDGLSFEDQSCVAHTGSSGRTHTPTITCSCAETTSVVSSDTWQLDAVVTATCPDGTTAVHCTCHSAWIAEAYCGDSAWTPTSSEGCSKQIGTSVSSNRRRNHGAKVYALCAKNYSLTN